MAAEALTQIEENRAPFLTHDAVNFLLLGISREMTNPEHPQQAFVDALVSNMTVTENNAPAYKSTLDPCLDLFFLAVPGIEDDRLISLLSEAWKSDPLLTLKLVFNLRDVRDGKNDKKNFYVCMQWLINEHGQHVLVNLPLVPSFGYWKDLLEMLRWNLRNSIPIEQCMFCFSVFKYCIP